MGAAALLLSGCTVSYRNHVTGSAFTLHSNHDIAFLEETRTLIEAIFSEYQGLLGVPAKKLPPATFLFDGEGDVVDTSYSPDLLGYYVPFFRVVRVDTRPPWTRDPATLRQVLLHEIAHHFLVARRPGISRLCWLNEGLAGNLEMALEEGGRFEHVLLNPALLIEARNAVWARHPTVEGLLDLSWKEFHERSQKQENYALAWSLVYFLLVEHLPRERPLAERIDLLLDLERDEIASLEDAWLEFLRSSDPTARILELAGDPSAGSLARRWAIRQLGSVGDPGRAAVLEAVVGGLEDADAALRRESCLAVLRIASRMPAEPAEPRIAALLEGGLARLSRFVGDPAEPASSRRVVVETIGGTLVREPAWVGRLIELLDDGDAEVRAAAARGLAEADLKPTVVNPAFWRDPDPGERGAELEEWREWWTRQATPRDGAADAQ